MSTSGSVLDAHARVSTQIPADSSRQMMRWGESLADARQRARRGNGNRVSYDWVADQVSHIEPCRRSDVKRIESLGTRPESARDLRLALCLAAYYGFDRDAAAKVLGLDCSQAGLVGSDLQYLNPSWPG